MSEVLIYGAGMSGLIAACNLAREGYDVIVRDREESWGGSKVFNPSTHTTPLDLAATSEYIGIDIAPAFVPAKTIDLYVKDFKFPIPTPGGYHVERSNRPTSIDALLYKECVGAGVKFEFGEELRKEDLASLPPDTIIACGLNEEAYRHLDVPCSVWYAWQSRGEVEREGDAWIWMDECISEYAYCSMLNGIYFNLLPDYKREVSRESLYRYMEWMERHEGVTTGDWEYVRGVVPTAVPDNPALFRDKFIMCGTISGAFDPLLGFGISGAIVSGKVAAIAVSDREKAQEEFHRFTRNFESVFHFKKEAWYPVVAEVAALEKVLNALGSKRVFAMMMEGIKRSIGKSAIPGFSPLSCS
jgi:flavin-dependent dehydrogenase